MPDQASPRVLSILDLPLQLTYIADEVYRLKTELEIKYYGSVQPDRFNILAAPGAETLFEPGTRIWGVPSYQLTDPQLPAGEWMVQTVIGTARPQRLAPR
jgi:hypothetical protein